MSDIFHQTLKKHAKSFYFAGLLLDKQTLYDASVLYAFCRQLDDAADIEDLSEKSVKLQQLITDYRTDHSQNEINIAFKELKKQYQLNNRFIDDLILGVSSDLQFKQPKDLKELIFYSYQVAGTVGGLMARILGATNEKAWRFAIDLGIGMQLTNISRDVKEDALNNRIYLPQDQLGSDIDATTILNPEHKTKVYHVTKEILNTADKYYQSGFSGIYYIPKKNKFSILIAGMLYQSIGSKVLNNNEKFLKQRVYLTFFEKIIILIKEYLKQTKTLNQAEPHHQTQMLHQPYLNL
ncbi:phytoene/squalene synthase family protein [Pelagibacteraceae bacterium]|nr:phytoene/squalene synthase family protein [Pelagibacteraceae bacterium]